MASGSRIKTPPALREDIPYESWKKEIQIWQRFTSLEKEKQALAIFLSLEGKARETVLEVEVDDLNKDDGVEKVLAKLDNLFLKDKLQLAYTSYDNFEKFRRPSDMSMADYVAEFERLYNKAKVYEMVLPEGILAYKFLNNANLSDTHDKLIRATMTDLTYNSMKNQVKKIFGDLSLNISMNKSSTSSPQIKLEPEESLNFEAHTDDQENIVAYTRGSYRQRQQPRYRGRGRGNRQTFPGSTSAPKRNPTKPDGGTSTCNVCGSIYHWAKDCPNSYVNMQHKRSNNEEADYVSLYSDTMKCFVGETLGMAVLDSGCTKNVCGEGWLNCYLDTLTSDQLKNIKTSPSDANFKFGSGEGAKSMKKVFLPSVIGERSVLIETDVVKCDIPLLLSKDAMKKAAMQIDFKADVVKIFGKPSKLFFTSTGHYCIPIVEQLNHLKPKVQEHLSLFVNFDKTKTEEKLKLAKKLHLQFSHPTYPKLKLLLNDAGIVDPEMLEALKSIANTCDTCLKYRKAPPRPIVGLSMAHDFNETVGMDLKEWKKGEVKTWFLHLVDHATRYSASAVIKSKRKEVIVDEIFKIWIKIFGYPKKILVDNGGEFNNQDFRDFCENLNITIKTTAAESPWSNGLVERHNAIMGEGVSKVVEDTSCSLEVALAWAVSAKNALQNLHGFSSNQLVFGRNPNFPSVLHDLLPALEAKTNSEIVAENLNAMHSARKAFIASEASEKLRRALRHNVRTSGNVKYVTGDSVFYKRNDSNKWKGPGKVIGQDGQQVLVKHGSVYVRVHPCRLTLKSTQLQPTDFEDGGQLEHAEDAVVEKERQENIDAESSDGEDNEEVTTRDEVSQHIEESRDSNISQHINSRTASKIPRFMSKGGAQPSRPKVNQRISYLLSGSDSWKKGIIKSKAGKKTGKYKNWLNVESETDGSTRAMDWNKDIAQWHVLPAKKMDHLPESSELPSLENDKNTENDVVLFTEPDLSENAVLEAKQKEIENWRRNNVFEEVPDHGQKVVSVRWVFTDKYIDGKHVTKARLVARGFEESELLQTDSPTCSKESIRLMTAIIASKGWRCNGIDVKAAFLQGKTIDRDVYIKPPPEIESQNILWKLNVCVYGLNDASRTWYLRVCEELKKLGAKQCRYESALFYWHHQGKLEGVISIHVDDLFWGGTDLFKRSIIAGFKEAFEIGKESSLTFQYLGLKINQSTDKIVIDQNNYAQSLCGILVSKERSTQKHLPLGVEEKKKLRTLIGQLSWVGTQTRPDILFECSELASSLKDAKVEHLVKANKLLKRLQQSDSHVVVSKLQDMKTWHFVTYHDASFANLDDGGSQGAYVIFLTDETNDLVVPIAWQSKRIKRVVKSTLAAETLSLVEGAEASFWMKSVLNELTGNTDFDIECRSDSQSLCNAVRTSTAIADKRLRVDIAILREMLLNGELRKVVWVPTTEQLADCMTKKGRSSSNLLQVFSSNKL